MAIASFSQTVPGATDPMSVQEPLPQSCHVVELVHFMYACSPSRLTIWRALARNWNLALRREAP